MMKYRKIILAVFVLLTIMSFKEKPTSEAVKTGIYGVCNCGKENAIKVELTISEDYTFRYFDNHDTKNVIDIKGTWVLKNNTVMLKDYKSDAPISNKWAIDKNEKCLKSRKGLAFTRLCHIKSCN